MKWPEVRCTGAHPKTILGKVAPDKKLHIRLKSNLGHTTVIVEKGEVICPKCDTRLQWDATELRKENINASIDRL